jgi:hypothetical protein
MNLFKVNYELWIFWSELQFIKDPKSFVEDYSFFVVDFL